MGGFFGVTQDYSRIYGLHMAEHGKFRSPLQKYEKQQVENYTGIVSKR